MIIDFSPRPCPGGCGQRLDLDTFAAAVFCQEGGPYPDDMLAFTHDEAGHVLSIDCPEPPAEAYAEAVNHYLLYHKLV